MLTREELQRFLIQAKFEGYYEVFLLDLATGLRRGELMALQWDDLNFKTGVLNVNKQVYDVRGQLQISTPQDEELRPQDRPAACCGGGAAGVQKDGGLPLDVPVPGEGGLPHHTRRGAAQIAAHSGARRMQACTLSRSAPHLRNAGAGERHGM